MQKDLSLGGTALTSVWMLRLGDRDCEIVLGNEGQIEMRDPIVQMVVDVADATKQYQAYTQGIDGYMGFKAGGKFSALRIANVATGATGDKLTDDVLYDAFSMFDDNRGPDLIVTHRKAIRDLRDSRTATNPTGVPAPWPTSWEGIPLISTNALTVAEVEET